MGISGAGDSVVFNPSALEPREYTVTARSSKVPQYKDTCVVRVVYSGFKVFVDQPGSGGDSDPFEWISFPDKIDIGHAFWMYTNSYPAIVKDVGLRFFVNKTIGYYPDDPGPTLFSPSVNGFLYIPDDDHLASHEVDHCWGISLEKLLDGLRYAQRLRKNPGIYNLNSNNCADAVVGAGSAVGVTVPDPQGTWPFGGGSNPGAMGEALRVLNGNN